MHRISRRNRSATSGRASKSGSTIFMASSRCEIVWRTRNTRPIRPVPQHACHLVIANRLTDLKAHDPYWFENRYFPPDSRIVTSLPTNFFRRGTCGPSATR